MPNHRVVLVLTRVPVCAGSFELATAASEFGAELDSLCDLVDFGVAPSLTIYAWYRPPPPLSTLIVQRTVTQTLVCVWVGMA